MTNGWETVVGLEVHVELATETKVWCGCKNEFGAEPNTNVCPVCLALPGALPVLNERALELIIKAGLALNCQIERVASFHRKNYFYPDLPTGYQITQFDLPLCYDGYVEITKADGTSKRIRIERIHLENDAGKLLHAGDDVAAAHSSLVDFNRAGVPLIEIVTKPDIRSAEEAGLFLNKLRSILKYTGVSDVKMEEGSLRCDINISVRPEGAAEYGTRCELKNVNSVAHMMRAIEYEAARQIDIITAGGVVEQETRSWRNDRGVSVLLRTKEDAEDYRYFPEPDLPPVAVAEELVGKVRASLPELPDAVIERLMGDYGLSRYDASLIATEREYVTWFDEAVELAGAEQAKAVANWQLNELFRIMNERGFGPEQIPVTPNQLAGLLKLIQDGTITGKIAKDVFEKMVDSDLDAATIVKREGLTQVSDEDSLREIARRLVAENPRPVQQWIDGKETVAQWFMGQVMKETRGRANPQVALKLVIEALNEHTAER